MYIGGSLFLLVVGAVLRWAVTWQVSGFNVQQAGLIIFLVGILGLIVSFIFWFTRRSSRGLRRDDGLPPRDYRPADSLPGDYPPNDLPPRP